MTPWERGVLARTLWGEARGEPIEGQFAVGHAILNRMRLKHWSAGHTIAGTCGKHKQFSAWNDSCPERDAMFDLTDDDLALIYPVVDALETDVDPTGSASHYYSVLIPEPSWVVGAEFTVQIGKHRFFRGVK